MNSNRIQSRSRIQNRNRSRSISVFVAAFAWVTVFATASAHAYIPPSQFLIKQIVNKRKDIKLIKIRSLVTTLEGDKPGPIRFTAMTLFNVPAGSVKSWAVGDNGVRLYGIQRRGTILPPIDSLLFDAKLGELIRSLRDVGIPIRTEDELRTMKDEDERRGAEVQHLERWKSTIAWVIGRKMPPDSHDLNPQLWIEKDSFVPLRLVYAPKGGDWVDVRFESPRSSRGFQFPRLVTVFGKEGVPLLREEVIDVAVNPKADEIEEAVENGYTEAGNTSPTATRELIDRYFGTVR
jgi:hypothetical protein